MEDYIINDKSLFNIELIQDVSVRRFKESDFSSIQNLYKEEGWITFINRDKDALEAWKNSNIAIVAVEGDKIVGLVRGLTDGNITTFIAEIIVHRAYRGKGIGKALLDICHQLYPKTRIELLADEEVYEFYTKNKFRKIMGFRKNYEV
ncbi:GNAT family N-acetyltransferase [Clostridium sp. UBA6640]|uniref:GNAT family N-acetyltransferase n=1 Tax=Clostridium sp. UBA6640 TaxID=1946370 RepID=UPI0025C327CA|nr:GNAT family N-acetyltransferase [Clostridium sp. UBA6640]